MEKRGQNLFKCDLCHFSCTVKQMLFRHQSRTHFDQVQFKYKCDSCRTGFSNRYSYVLHTSTIHNDTGSRFKCTINCKNHQGEGNEIVEYECGKTFQLLGSARRHLQSLHKIQTKTCEQAKKYFKIVTIKSNLFRTSKYSFYGGNQNQNPQNENNEEVQVVSAVVDDPDEILKILENNETDDVESQVPYSSENICIIEEKFIPDVTLVLPIDDVNSNIDEINDKTDDQKQNKEKDIKIKKSFVQKLTGKSKAAVKKKKLVNLQSNKVTTKSQVPKRASLSRSCKNSVEILQTSTRQFDSEPEFEPESDSESELFKSKSMLKVKSPKNVNKNKSSTRQQLDSEPESESDTDFEPEPEIKVEVKSPQKDKNEATISCHLCEKKFKRKVYLKDHLISKLHSENRVECTKCPKSHYVVKGSLVNHHKYGRKRLKNVKEKKIHYCKECNIFFKTVGNLNKHLKRSSRHVPNRGKKYFCEQCSSGFTNAPGLKKHMQARHENDGTRFECKICVRSYGRYDSLLGHFKKEEHILREQDFQKKNQDNPVKIKKEK